MRVYFPQSKLRPTKADHKHINDKLISRNQAINNERLDILQSRSLDRLVIPKQLHDFTKCIKHQYCIDKSNAIDKHKSTTIDVSVIVSRLSAEDTKSFKKSIKKKMEIEQKYKENYNLVGKSRSLTKYAVESMLKRFEDSQKFKHLQLEETKKKIELDEIAKLQEKPIINSNSQGIVSLKFNNDSTLRESFYAQKSKLVKLKVEQEADNEIKSKMMGLHYGKKVSTEDLEKRISNMIDWENKKKAKVLKRKQELSESELIGCSFAPRINSNFNYSMSSNYSRMSVGERLYSQRKIQKGKESNFVNIDNSMNSQNSQELSSYTRSPVSQSRIHNSMPKSATFNKLKEPNKGTAQLDKLEDKFMKNEDNRANANMSEYDKSAITHISSASTNPEKDSEETAQLGSLPVYVRKKVVYN